MPAFTLKIIALACMILDHLGAVFPMYFPIVFRIIGRVAFPIYVYLIADGCRHTRSMPKYLLRLGIFALISQIPFDLAFNNQQAYLPVHISFIRDTNVFYTLFLGALCVFLFQKLQTFNSSLLAASALLPLLAVMRLAEWMQTDYGGFGVAFVFLMYVVPKKVPRLMVMALCCLYEFYPVALGLVLDDYALYANARGLWMLAACLLAVPLAALYNGQRGPKMKWFFYVSYPAHLLAFGCIWILLVR